jgi:hypothetical protein
MEYQLYGIDSSHGGNMMGLTKRTYALPSDTVSKFEESIPSGQRSAVVAQLLRDWLAEKERLRLRQEIIEGCRDMAEIYLQVEKEFHPLEEEVARAFGEEPQPRRHRPAKSRSRRRV